jgi:hypothetical protein
MSAIFQRPLCDMGAVYDFSFRPLLGEPENGTGGPCDDRPHRVEVFSAAADPATPAAAWRSFSLCPEHESQLRRADDRLRALGRAARFRAPVGAPPGSPPR